MKTIKNIYYSIDKSNSKVLDIYLPDTNKFDLIIYIHGGALECGDKDEIKVASEYLLKRNVAIITINYRMYPNAKYPDYIEDSIEAIKWSLDNINNYGECNNIYIVGTSAGAYISLMLCFNTKLLKDKNIDTSKITGYIHNAGQSTSHFNLLREKNLDSRRVIIDETAPLYYVGLEKEYPRMLFIVTNNDIVGRYEQTMLLLTTLKDFKYDSSKYKLLVLDGLHCDYVSKLKDNESVFGKIIYDFISE